LGGNVPQLSLDQSQTKERLSLQDKLRHNTRMPNLGDTAVFSRRRMLERSCLGFGSIVLADLLNADTKPSSEVRVYSDLAARSTHFPAKAKAVIQLVQNGGPSQMDLFDPKPELARRAGQPHPDGVEIHQPGNHNLLLPSPFEFHKYGQCGMDVSDALPHGKYRGRPVFRALHAHRA
jgi:Protein of unknown function (DUF1501)